MSPQNEALWSGRVVGAQNGGIIGVHVDMDEKIISFDFNYEKNVAREKIPWTSVRFTLEWFFLNQTATLQSATSQTD
jgi:hypothetical protein